jgi:hypothetical protein
LSAQRNLSQRKILFFPVHSREKTAADVEEGSRRLIILRNSEGEIISEVGQE